MYSDADLDICLTTILKLYFTKDFCNRMKVQFLKTILNNFDID